MQNVERRTTHWTAQHGEKEALLRDRLKQETEEKAAKDASRKDATFAKKSKKTEGLTPRFRSSLRPWRLERPKGAGERQPFFLNFEP